MLLDAAECCLLLVFATDGMVRFVGLSIMTVSPANMAEPIEMPFRMWTRMGPRNHVLDGSTSPQGKGLF